MREREKEREKERKKGREKERKREREIKFGVLQKTTSLSNLTSRI